MRGDELNSSVKSVLKARRKGPSKGDLVCGVEGAGQPQTHTNEGASPEKGGGAAAGEDFLGQRTGKKWGGGRCLA